MTSWEESIVEGFLFDLVAAVKDGGRVAAKAVVVDMIAKVRADERAAIGAYLVAKATSHDARWLQRLADKVKAGHHKLDVSADVDAWFRDHAKSEALQ